MTVRARAHGLRIPLIAVMGLVALAAVVCRWPVLAGFAAPVAAYGVLRKLGPPPGAEGLREFALVAGVVYLPCVIGFFSDCDHCRTAWLTLFPAVPGLYPSLLVLSALRLLGRVPEATATVLAALLTSVWLVALTLVGRCGNSWLAAALVVGLAYSGLAAWVLSALIRA
jgi:hypothetical protein